MKATLLTAMSLLVFVAASSSTAHHSFASTFDRARPVKVSGKITKVQWGNPHIWFFIDVANSDGSTSNWGFETNPPGLMQRIGITKERLAIGETITVEGFGTRDGSNNARTAK